MRYAWFYSSLTDAANVIEPQVARALEEILLLRSIKGAPHSRYGSASPRCGCRGPQSPLGEVFCVGASRITRTPRVLGQEAGYPAYCAGGGALRKRAANSP